MVKEIPLNQGFSTWVDDEDFERIIKRKWQVVKNRYTFYARCGGGLSDGQPYMHRYILGDIPKGNVVDHINGCGLDNRKSNLQIISQSENVKKMDRNRPLITALFLHRVIVH